MKKLTMVVVMLTVLVAVAMPTASALCVNSGGEACDVVTLLRGAVRVANGERCRQRPQPVDCPLTEIAGLSK